VQSFEPQTPFGRNAESSAHLYPSFCLAGQCPQIWATRANLMMTDQAHGDAVEFQTQPFHDEIANVIDKDVDQMKEVEEVKEVKEIRPQIWLSGNLVIW
jgi:hypothetical protein